MEVVKTIISAIIIFNVLFVIAWIRYKKFEKRKISRNGIYIHGGGITRDNSWFRCHGCISLYKKAGKK
jgi:hypothetical protein